MDNSIIDKSTNSPNNAASKSSSTSNGDEEMIKPVANLSSQVVSANGLVNSASASLASSTASPLTSSMLSIKVHIKDLNLAKTLQFNPTTLVFDALKIIREKVPETNTEAGKKFFLSYLFLV